MSKNTSEFLSWATDSNRNLEERYSVLRLIEFVYLRHYQGKDKVAFDWNTMKQIREQRIYNPAYIPLIELSQLRIVAELLPQVTLLHMEPMVKDRPLRDLSFLAFLPQLADLKIRDFECENLEALRHLSNLRILELHGDEVEDYSALAACRELREIRITTAHPWPKLAGLAELPHLERLFWNGNGCALVDIPRLPALKALHVESFHFSNEPKHSIRDLHQLPAMPHLEHLCAGWFFSLEGVERYPLLRFLSIRGFFKDLVKLTVLSKVTHLRITCPRVEELAPIASLPSMIHFALLSERPQDWGALMENETLREVFHYGFEGDQPDLAMLKMLMPSRDDLFLLQTPRPLGPMRIMVRGKDTDESGQLDCSLSADFPDGPDGWAGNLAMRQSEIWWVEEYLPRVLREAGYMQLQGVKKSGSPPDLYSLFSNELRSFARRQFTMFILKSEAISKIPEIFQCLREALSRICQPWQILFFVQPEPDAQDWDNSWQPPEKTPAESMEELEQEMAHRDKLRQIFLKDRHRLRILKELGQDTSDFKPTPLPRAPWEIPKPPIPQPDPAEEDNEEDDASGGIADADPEKETNDEIWIAPVKVDDPNHQWNDLNCMLVLTEHGVHMHLKNRGLPRLAELLDVIPERLE